MERAGDRVSERGREERIMEVGVYRKGKKVYMTKKSKTRRERVEESG